MKRKKSYTLLGNRAIKRKVELARLDERRKIGEMFKNLGISTITQQIIDYTNAGAKVEVHLNPVDSDKLLSFLKYLTPNKED